MGLARKRIGDAFCDDIGHVCGEALRHDPVHQLVAVDRFGGQDLVAVTAGGRSLATLARFAEGLSALVLVVFVAPLDALPQKVRDRIDILIHRIDHGLANISIPLLGAVDEVLALVFGPLELRVQALAADEPEGEKTEAEDQKRTCRTPVGLLRYASHTHGPETHRGLAARPRTRERGRQPRESLKRRAAMRGRFRF